jgi:Ca-activated chloride channel homolog
MSFQHPSYLYALLLVPVFLALRSFAQLRSERVVALFTAARLRHRLSRQADPVLSWLVFSLQMLGLVGFTLAAARPQWGEDKTEQKEAGRNVILAIDCSRSMLADDVKPNRLTRAQLAAQDIMALLPTDRVGLIAFSGNAYLQAPLTRDHEAILEAIQSLDYTSVPRGGTELGRALRLAMDTFAKTKASSHGLILFSDGGEPEVELQSTSEDMNKKGIRVITVGVGTRAGSLIPDPDPRQPGDYVRDTQGNVVKTRLEPKLLQDVAKQTRGRYLELGSQPLPASSVRDILAFLEKQQNANKELVKPIERYQWPLGAGFLALTLAWFLPVIRSGFRSRAVQQTTLAPLAATVRVTALLLGLLWLSPAQAISFNDPEEANKATADRKRGEISPETLKRFSDALLSKDTQEQSKVHRALAGALYETGGFSLDKKLPQKTIKAWRDSLKHFDEALKVQSADIKLKENRDFVQARLDELLKKMEEERKKQEAKQKGKKGKKGSKGNQGQKGQQGKQGQKGQNGEQGQEGQDGEQGEQGENGQEPGDGSQGEGNEEPTGEESQAKQSEEAMQGVGDAEKEQQKEGKIEAAGGSQPKPNAQSQGHSGSHPQTVENSEDSRNETTGYTPQEAAELLRAYADDSKKAQRIQQREMPRNGKDW